jgi:AcrR family transcriptional regulator
MAEAKRHVFQSRGAARLEALTRAAADMFLESGFDALSIDALIERAGGSRRNVYEHFGGKEGLFIEAIARRCDELAAPLRALDIDTAATPARALTLFARALIAIVLAPETLALHRLMVAEGKRFPDVARAMWLAGHDTAAQILAVWIHRQQLADRLRYGDDPHLLARQFIALATADAQLRALVGFGTPTNLEIARIADHAVETFLEGRLEDEM